MLLLLGSGLLHHLGHLARREGPEAVVALLLDIELLHVLLEADPLGGQLAVLAEVLVAVLLGPPRSELDAGELGGCDDPVLEVDDLPEALVAPEGVFVVVFGDPPLARGQRLIVEVDQGGPLRLRLLVAG